MGKIKVLHIFPNDIFVGKYIDGFRQHRNDNYEHLFYLYGAVTQQSDRQIEVFNTSDVVYADMKCEGLEQYIERTNIVVLGAIPENYDMIQRINESIPNKKLIIVPYGRELYRTSDLYRCNDENLIKRIDEQKKILIKRSKLVVVGEVGRKYIEDFYQSSPKTVLFDCLNSLEMNVKFERKTVKDRCNIMLGHRGTATGGHIEVLESLEKFKDKIDQIICPLSYGNKGYIDQVTEAGKCLYGEKFHSVDKWILKDEYDAFLNDNVDVAIFNYNTSEGFNTLLSLCEMGKKIYVNPLNDSYYDLVQMGFPVFKWEKEDIDFGEIRKPLDEIQQAQVEKTMIDMNQNYGFQKWFEILERI